MNRRRLLHLLLAVTGAGFALRTLAAAAGWNTEAFSATTENDATRAFFGDETITPSNAVSIGMRDLVENGAYVPVKIETTLPDPESITILVEKNPNPLIASFELGPGCRGFVATRIKVGEPSDVIAVVRSRGTLYSTRQFVKVIHGGCN